MGRPVFERPSACVDELELPPPFLKIRKQTLISPLLQYFWCGLRPPFSLLLNRFFLTLSLVLEHLEELLDAFVPCGQRLLLGVDPHLQLLMTRWLEVKYRAYIIDT